METFESLIKNTDSNYIRGVDLGMGIPELKKMENGEGQKRKGAVPHILYHTKPSDSEELKIQYGYDKQEKKVESILFLYHYYPADDFERRNEGMDLLSFIHEENRWGELLVGMDAVLQGFIQHFSSRYGDPKISTKGRAVFLKTHYEWKNDEALIRMSYHFDDNGYDSWQVLRIDIGTL